MTDRAKTTTEINSGIKSNAKVLGGKVKALGGNVKANASDCKAMAKVFGHTAKAKHL